MDFVCNLSRCKVLLHSFNSVDFMCVRRETNSTTRALAKLASQSQAYTFYNIDSLPLLYEAWLKDVDSCD